MNIKVSEIGFQGKKEILYGLEKAADNIHSYSMYNQPRLLRFGENKDNVKYQTAASTYLDMVTKDSEFVNVVKDFTNKDLIKVKKHLMPQENGVKPFEYFKNFLNNVMNRNGATSSKEREAQKTLLGKLA